MTNDAYPYRATFEFELPKRTAEDLVLVLMPEGLEEGERTSVIIREEEDGFVLDVGSSDIKGLRAAMNSYLRWIDCSLQVTELPK